jgi:hypothetical protein
MHKCSVKKCWWCWTDGAGVGCGSWQRRKSQTLTFPPCLGLFAVASCQRDQCGLLSYTLMLQKRRQCTNPYYNGYFHSTDRSPSPSGSPQSSPRPSPRQDHRRDHSKGEIPVGICKENSPLDKSDIIEVSKSVCLLVCEWVTGEFWMNCSAQYGQASLCSLVTTQCRNYEVTPHSTFVLCHMFFYVYFSVKILYPTWCG